MGGGRHTVVVAAIASSHRIQELINRALGAQVGVRVARHACVARAVEGRLVARCSAQSQCVGVWKCGQTPRPQTLIQGLSTRRTPSAGTPLQPTRARKHTEIAALARLRVQEVVVLARGALAQGTREARVARAVVCLAGCSRGDNNVCVRGYVLVVLRSAAVARGALRARVG